MAQEKIVIVSGARTPVGRFQGALATQSAPMLGAVATRAAVERAKITQAQVNELLFGTVLPAGAGQAPARQVALGAGLDIGTQCTTINKVCGSGMKAAMIAHDQLKAGSCEIVVAGGMESMTNAPYLLPNARAGLRMGHKQIKDHMFYDGLEDAYTGAAMGSFAQNLADKYQLTRAQMDAYALESAKRAQKAAREGYFKAEITPINIKTRKGEVEITEDELPANSDAEKIARLKPAFAEGGTITAANSSSISDGAAALVLTTLEKANELSLKPMAQFVAHTSHAQAPEEFPIAPIEAIRKLLDKTGWDKESVDLFEINEAFAMVTMRAIDALGLDAEKVNIQGGGLVLGHPIGASGARIIVTLLYALQRLGLKRGIACLCIGGGEATAIGIEML